METVGKAAFVWNWLFMRLNVFTAVWHKAAAPSRCMTDPLTQCVLQLL